MPAGQGWTLPFLELDGPSQMALDRWLLEQSVTSGTKSPVLRFYGWKGPWLSLGRHQVATPPHWQALADAGVIKLVRRPSGGGAVLHSGGLTYALIWPGAPRQRREAYRQTSTWLIDSFQSLGHTLVPGRSAATARLQNCFAGASAADLVDREPHNSGAHNSEAHKRIGSAQYWLHGHLLQHGEIVLQPPADLWETLFDSTPPAPLEALTQQELITALTQTLQNRWPEVHWHGQTLGDDAWQQVKSASGNYRLA
jgi:lipoate-protein ligase A